MEGSLDWADDARNPWRNDGRPWRKPVVAAVQGWCLTLGIELVLAADVRIASADARFAQLKVQRGIYPFGGATTRLPREAGWGNAMRWLLTGDGFDAAEALRIGLVKEVVEPDEQVDRAVELAERIATRSAPLAVRTTLAAAQRAHREGERAAEDRFVDDVVALFKSKDRAQGMLSFVERPPTRFMGA
jgi:enoyl-CoA hydratase